MQSAPRGRAGLELNITIGITKGAAIDVQAFRVKDNKYARIPPPGAVTLSNKAVLQERRDRPAPQDTYSVGYILALSGGNLYRLLAIAPNRSSSGSASPRPHSASAFSWLG
jgi:hypothetical protein